MPNIPNRGYWQPNLIFNRSDCFLSVALVNNQYLLFVVSNPQHPLISSHRCERTAIECKIVLCFFLLVRLMSSWLRRHVSSWTGRRLFSAFFTKYLQNIHNFHSIWENMIDFGAIFRKELKWDGSPVRAQCHVWTDFKIIFQFGWNDAIVARVAKRKTGNDNKYKFVVSLNYFKRTQSFRSVVCFFLSRKLIVGPLAINMNAPHTFITFYEFCIWKQKRNKLHLETQMIPLPQLSLSLSSSAKQGNIMNRK